MSDAPADALPDPASALESDDDVRAIENPPEIIWGDSRSLLLTLRHAHRMLRTDPDLVDDLLSLAYMDARQIIEDADTVVRAVRGRPSACGRRPAPWLKASRANWKGTTRPTSKRRSQTTSTRRSRPTSRASPAVGAVPDHPGRNLRSIVDAEPAEHLADVVAHRPPAHHQTVGDLRVRQPLRDQPCDFELTARQRRSPRLLLLVRVERRHAATVGVTSTAHVSSISSAAPSRRSGAGTSVTVSYTRGGGSSGSWRVSAARLARRLRVACR